MRTIDADELKKHKIYSEIRHEYIVPVCEIDNAPTIEERPTGKWVVDIIGYKGDKTTSMRFKCSKCGTVISWIPGEKYPTKESFLDAHPGCFCGARMEVAEKEAGDGCGSM